MTHNTEIECIFLFFCGELIPSTPKKNRTDTNGMQIQIFKEYISKKYNFVEENGF